MDPTDTPTLDPSELIWYNCVREHDGVHQQGTVVDVNNDLEHMTL